MPEIKTVLNNLKSIQGKNKKLFENEYFHSDYIFTWNNGKLFRPDYVTQTFRRILLKNGFPKIRFHDLRHSCASILYDKGWALKDIQTWLGHAAIQTTGDIYTHITNTRKKILAKDLEGTFEIVAG